MRLVGFDEFCSMPAGTIFMPYERCIGIETLAIKTDDGHQMPEEYPYYRWYFNGVMPLEPRLGPDNELFNIGDQADASFEIYDNTSSEYMDYKTFLVFEDLDVELMINVLLWAKNGCVGKANCNDYM